MKTTCLFAILISAAVCRLGAADAPPSPFEAPGKVVASWSSSGKIDELVFGRLKTLGIEPAYPCNEATFLRRVYLDMIGTLPTASEAEAYLADPDPRKRAVLIDRLLERGEFAEYWGMKWADLLRVKSEFPVNLWPNAAQAYDRWIRDSLRANRPYSQFARELLTANGSNFRAPQVNFYRSAGSREPKALARAVALTFMGERAEKWPEAKLAGMAEFFSQVGFKSTDEWKEEIVYFNGDDSGKISGNNGDRKAVYPDGTAAKLPPGQDPRELFAKWLVESPHSPFARNAVNRVWYWLMGRGIVEEPDDSRPDNPPINPELLDWLARELVRSGYDMKHVCRLILNSRAYQLSCVPRSAGPEAARNFAFRPLRRMEAEVLVDALNGITGSTDEYSSIIPEPFTWIPAGERSISLPDGSINSAFLEMFGRPPRDTGVLAERNNKPTAAQELHLLNSGHIQGKIRGSAKLKALFATPLPPQKLIEQIYLTVLSRYPTADEVALVNDYAQTAEAGRSQSSYDLVWALINSSEFLYRH